MEKSYAITAKRNLAKSGPVGLAVTPIANDKAMVQITVDYSKAEIPTRAYYADYCSIEPSREAFVLIFGKLIPRTSDLRTMLEISFPKDLLVRQLWQGSKAFYDTVKQSCTRLSPLHGVKLTDKTQSFRANNVFMVSLGDEALLDFYYIAPSDIHYVRDRKKESIDLNPVVRIVTGTAVVCEFLESVDSTVTALPDLEAILKFEENE